MANLAKADAEMMFSHLNAYTNPNRKLFNVKLK